MLSIASGRAVPANPGWVGVITRTSCVFVNSSPKRATVSGPPPPCSSKNGWPLLLPLSPTVTSTGPTSARFTMCAVLVTVSPWSAQAMKLSAAIVRSGGDLGEVGGRDRRVPAHDVGGGLRSQRLAAGDHVPQIPEVVHVEIRCERVQEHRRLVAGIGERVRGARRDHHQRACGRLVRLVGHGEQRGPRYDVKPLVMLGMPMLERPERTRGEGDLADPEPVAGGTPVLKDSHLDWPQLDQVATIGPHYGNLDHLSPIRDSRLS